MTRSGELRRRVSRRGARLAALAAVAAVAFAGCGNSSAALDTGMSDALGALTLSGLDGPHEGHSKSVKYLAATGTAGGDVDQAVADAVASLRDAGFDMSDPATAGATGLAAAGRRDDVAVQIAVFDQIGSRPAPEDSSWVQVQVVAADADLAWIPPRS